MALEQAGLEWINKGLPGFVSDINKADTAMGDAGRESESAGGKFTALGSIITGVATGMTTFALDAVAGLGKALVGFGKDSLTIAADFQSSMATLTIAASATGLSFDDLSDAALAVGGDTSLLGVSATGAAGAMEGLFKAGLTTQEIFGDLQGYMAGTADLGGTLRASIDLAAASALDMVQAADLAGITIATFGHEAEAAGISTDEWIIQAMDNMVRAADASAAEVEDLQGALMNVGPTAAAFGFSFADVNNALAILSTRGTKGAEAGTALKSMMTNLLRTTPAVTGALDELGIALYDQEGVMRSLPDIMGQFQVAMEGMTEEQKNQYIQTLAGTYGMKTMQTLLDEGVEGWYAMEEATANAASMQEQAAAKGETYAAQMEALEGVIETLQISIGTPFLKAMTGVVGVFASIIEKHGPLVTSMFEGIGEAVGNLVETLGGFLSGEISLGDLIPDTGPIATFVGALQTIGDWFTENRPAIEAALLTIQRIFQDTFGAMVGAFQEAWPELQAAFADIQEAFAMLGIEFDDSGSIIQTVASVISAVIIGVGTIVSGVFRAVTAVVSFFAEHFKDSLEIAINIATGFKDWIQGIMDVIGGIFTGDWERVKKGFLKSWKGMAKTIVNVVKMIVKGITMPFRAVYKVLEGFVKGVIKFFKDLAKKLVGGSIIPDMMDKMLGVIEDVLDAILDFWRGIFEDILETTEKIFDDIEETIDTIMASIEDIIETISESIQDIWESFTELLQEVWEDVWNAIEEFVDDTFNAIEDLIDSISESISDLWEAFADLLQEVWETAWDAIEEFVNSTFNAIEDLIDSISDSISEIWESFTDTLEEVWETTWSAIEEFVDTTFAAIEELIDSISGNIEEAWDTFTENIEEVWETVWGAIEEFVDTTFSDIEELIDTISGNIEEAWDTFTASVQETWETVWGAVEEFVDTTFSDIEELIDTISGNIEEAWDTFTGNVEEVWSTMWEAIEDFVDVGGIFESIEDLVGEISGNIEEAWETFTEAVETFWSDMWDAIEDFVDVGGIFENVETLLGSISSSIQTTWETFTGALSTAWSTVFDALAGIVQTAFDAAGSGVRAILAAAIEALTTIFSVDLVATVKSIGTRIVQLIVDAIVLFSNVGGSFVENVTSTLSGWFSDLVAWNIGWISNAKDIGKEIVERILAGISGFSTIVGNFVAVFSSQLGTWFDSVAASSATWVTNAKDIGGAILDRIMEGVEAVTQWASDFWTWLWDQIWEGISGDSGAQDVGNAAGTMLMDGIADGIRNDAYIVQSALNSVISGLSVPSITIPIHEETISGGTSYAAAPVSPAPVLPTQPQSISTSITIGPNTITDIMDMAEFEARVVQAVTTAI